MRERRGRVYSIYSFMSSFIDSGYLGIYAGTNPEWVEEVLEVTLGEVNKIARSGLTNEELARAKSQLKGNMLLGMESTESRMNRVARNEIYFGREIPLEELAQRDRQGYPRPGAGTGGDVVLVRQDGVGAVGRSEGAQVRPRRFLRTQVSFLRAQ